MNILQRLYRIAKANMPDSSDFLSGKKAKYEEKEFEDFDKFNQETKQEYGYNRNNTYDYSSTNKQHNDNNTYGVPQQVLDDLGVFELAPPSSFAEVKKARNREVKKFHSDKFMNDPKKMETSKEIMQIINAAYDRLETYYEKKS